MNKRCSREKMALINELAQINEKLDIIQETNTFQVSEKLMNEIGEAMGHIDNAIGMIENSQ